MHFAPVTFAEENKTATGSGSNFGIQSLIQDVNNLQKEASAEGERKQKNLSEIIKRADTLITNRINELNKNLTRIQNDKRLTNSQKQSLTNQIQDTINGLTSLKTKIDADTNTSFALSDAKQIFTNFRVYEILEPKINLLIMLNNIQTVTTNLQNLMPQLQNLVGSFKSQGKDTTQLESLINDINTQISAIQTTITQDIAKVQEVNINTTNPSVTFQQIRKDLEDTVKTGFQKIRTDIGQMRPIFKEMISPATTQ